MKDSMEEKSKTQKKKDALSLQKLGERLVGLSNDLINEIHLPPDLHDAVMDAKTIKKHGALKRQMQYIGSLMRKCDPGPIEEALHNLDAGNYRKAVEFQQLEHWRDELISGNDTLLDEIANVCPDCDRQRLSRLVRQARKEINEASPKASRALFRYLRSIRTAADQE